MRLRRCFVKFNFLHFLTVQLSPGRVLMIDEAGFLIYVIFDASSGSELFIF